MEFYTDKFRALRKKKKISMKDVAEMMGINWQTIWNWENKKIVPSEAKVRHLCNCLDINIEEISDIEITAEVSDNELNGVADSWFSFIDPEMQKDIQYEKLIVDNIRRQSAKLQKATILLNALLSYINAIFYVKDSNLRYMIANTQFKENLSLTSNYNTKGKHDEDLFIKSEAKKNREQDQKVIDTGYAIEHYEDYIPGSRKQKWGLISKIPVLDSNGKIAGVIGSFIDITERKRKEEIRKLLIQAFDEGPDCIFLLNKERTKNIYLSGNIEKQYGYPKEKFYEKGFWFNCLHHDDKKIEDLYINKRKILPKRRNFRIVKPDGEVRYIEETLHVGEKYSLGVERDITLKKKEEEIRKLLELNVNAMSEGIIISDIETSERYYINEAFSKIYGYPLNYLYKIEKKFFSKKILHHDQVEKYNSLPSASERDGLIVEFKIINGEDKKEHWVEISYNVTDFNGKKCILSISRDITEKKEKEFVYNLLVKALDETNDSIWLMDEKRTKILHISDSVEREYGYPAHKFLNDADFWITCVHPGDKDREADYRKTKKIPPKRQYRIVRADGAVRVIEETIHIGGDYSIGIERDITERKKEKEIQTLLEFNVNAMKDGLIIFDKDNNKYIFINNAIVDIYGYSLEDFYSKGRDFWYNKCIHPDFKETVKEVHSKINNTIIEYKIIRSDGDVRWIHCTLNEKKFLDRKCYIAVERDITEEKCGMETKINNIALNLLKENIDLSVISKSTGLSLTDIEHLRKSINY